VKRVRTTCHAPELSEANSNARLSHSKQLLKNIHPLTLASFCSLAKTFTVPTPPKKSVE